VIRKRQKASVLVRSFSVILIAVIFAVFGLIAWTNYLRTIEQATQRAVSASEVIAEEVGWLVGSTMYVLGGVQQRLSGDPASLTPAVKLSLDGDVQALPVAMTLAVYDTAGQIVGDAAQAPSDIRSMPAFLALKDGAVWTITQGDDDTPIPQVKFAVGARLEINGMFSGAALAIFDVGTLERFWTPLKLETGATVSMVRDDGEVIARFPALLKPLNISALDTFREHLSKSPSGTYSATSPVDKVQRLVAFQHLPELGLIAMASTSLDTSLGQFWWGVAFNLLLLVPLATALLIGSLWTARILTRLEATVEQNKVLFQEVHHRVKNNLQSVSSLIQLQRDLPPQAKADVIRRIDSMAAVHQHLYQSDKFEVVAARDYLNAVVNGISQSHGDSIKISRDIDLIYVGNDAAMPLGLIVNEVVTNSYKYAFEDGRGNKTISISLKASTPGHAKLVIEDNGVGYDASTVKKKGMGTRLIDGLSKQMRGEANFSNHNGSRFELDFPTASET